MKKTGTDLFELIHSLTMAEKKYFKMFSSLKGGDKSYLKLYDATAKQHTYNEDAIRSACHGQKFLRHLSVAKRDLHTNILRSLENYHSSADINLHSRLRKVEILLRKGLTAQALKLLKEAKRIAYQHEQWEMLMEILVMERTPYATLDILTIPHLNEEMESVLKKINSIKDYRKIHLEIIQRFQKAEFMRTRREKSFIEKLMQHPLLRNSNQASCAEAKAYYYDIWSRYYLLKRDIIKGYKTLKEQCEFIETYFHQLRDPEKKHLAALNLSVIFMGYLLPDNRNIYSEMQEVLHKIRSYPNISSSLKEELWIYSHVNELNAYVMAGDFERVYPVLKAIEGSEDIVNQAPVFTRIMLYSNIAYLLFGAGNYTEALRWLRKAIDQPAGALREDAQAGARMLYLLIHYELHKDDEQMLDSLKRSTQHFLSTRQLFFKVEKALMHCMRQIIGKPISRKERSAAFKAFKTTLVQLRKNPLEKAAMENFDFLSWVESKIQNKTFAEVTRLRHRMDS
ncbi:MAG: hypothetical protein HY840_07460 [Bacteroidetes bacterium]|nr:hypothetical protein [Bacteroidota bacterium]